MNPADVVYNAFSQAFFQGMVRMFQSDNEMRNVVMTDQQAREQVPATSSKERNGKRRQARQRVDWSGEGKVIFTA
jgi:type I restriction enzyme R subunit